MNVTLSIDDRVVAKARRIAAARGTTLDQLISHHLDELARVDDVDAVVRELDAMWSERTYRSQRHGPAKKRMSGRERHATRLRRRRPSLVGTGRRSA